MPVSQDKWLCLYSSIKPVGEGTNVSLVVRRGRGVPVSSMSAAVSNHQLPSYMSGFLYPLGNKKGVYSFVRLVVRNPQICSEMLLEDSFWTVNVIYSIYSILWFKFNSLTAFNCRKLYYPSTHSETKEWLQKIALSAGYYLDYFLKNANIKMD